MSNIIYSFSCVKQAWNALPMESCESFSLVPAKVAKPTEFKACCKWHLASHPRCIYSVSAEEVPDFKPILAVYFIWGAGANRVCEEKIACMQYAKTFGACDAIKYVNGEWYGLGDGDACYYKDFVPGALPAEEFLNLISEKPSILMDYAGGVFNFYKFVFISSVYDPRCCYVDCYERCAGLLSAMSKVNLLHCVEKVSGANLHYAVATVQWDDAFNPAKDYYAAFRGYPVTAHFPRSVSFCLNKKRKRSELADEFKICRALEDAKKRK